MKKLLKNRIWVLLIVFVFFTISLIPTISSAQETTDTTDKTSSGYAEYPSGWEIIPEECLDPNTTTDETVNVNVNGKLIETKVIKRCDINSFVQLFVNLAFIMLKLSPPLAMVIVIYGGFRLLTSQGKQESIQTGKKILSSAFIGMLIIVFLGWTLTFFVVQTLTGQKSGKLFNDTTNLFTRDWWGGGSTGEDTEYLNMHCCLVNGVGCAMKTESECTKLGGYSDGLFPNGCGGQTDCENLKLIPKCCISPDGSDSNSNPDICTMLENDMAGCLQFPSDWTVAPECPPRTEVDNKCDRYN